MTGATANGSRFRRSRPRTKSRRTWFRDPGRRRRRETSRRSTGASRRAATAGPTSAFDERARELTQRVASPNEELERLEQRLREATEADRDALTACQLEDGKRPRPEPTAPALEREIEERRADCDAANQAIERVYADKAAYVERHRKRLVREADKATREAHGRVMDALDAYERAREELVESLEAALSAALYPSDLAHVFPAWPRLATGLRKPVKPTLGLKTVVPLAGVLALLRADAEILPEVATQDQAAALRGTTTARLMGREATWQQGEPDFVGPEFPAAWSGSEEQKLQAERAKRYTEQARKRIWGD
ncbi:MAG TPA: hypothetical protein VHF67_14200 [Gaiellaceae bacterium]|nr:hypothetical protein [Gaiellaceae bacterium]